MRRVLLIRTSSGDQGTFGWLITDSGLALRSLELPWKDNRRNISCIPTGDYRAQYLARSASGKYRRVYHLPNVDGRSGILIHSGNFAGDTSLGYRSHVAGCIILGTHAGYLGGQKAVLASRMALMKLRRDLNCANFKLEIHDNTQRM